MPRPESHRNAEGVSISSFCHPMSKVQQELWQSMCEAYVPIPKDPELVRFGCHLVRCHVCYLLSSVLLCLIILVFRGLPGFVLLSERLSVLYYLYLLSR